MAQGCTGALGQDLPGNQVGVVLHLGGDNLITLTQGELFGFFPANPLRGVPDSVSDKVQCLSSVRGPHEFLISGAHKTSNGSSRILEQVSGFNCESVRPPVYRRVRVQVEVTFGIKHLQGFLAGGPRIQIHQRVPIHLRTEDREIGAQITHQLVIQRRVRWGRVFCHGNLLLSCGARPV